MEHFETCMIKNHVICRSFYKSAFPYLILISGSQNAELYNRQTISYKSCDRIRKYTLPMQVIL